MFAGRGFVLVILGWTEGFTLTASSLLGISLKEDEPFFPKVLRSRLALMNAFE